MLLLKDHIAEMTEDSIEGHQINVGPVSIVRIAISELPIITTQTASDDCIKLVSLPSTLVIDLAPHPSPSADSEHEEESKYIATAEDLTSADFDPLGITTQVKTENTPELVFDSKHNVGNGDPDVVITTDPAVGLKNDPKGPQEVILNTDPSDKSKIFPKASESRKREPTDKQSSVKKMK